MMTADSAKGMRGGKASLLLAARICRRALFLLLAIVSLTSLFPLSGEALEFSLRDFSTQKAALQTRSRVMESSQGCSHILDCYSCVSSGLNCAWSFWGASCMPALVALGLGPEERSSDQKCIGCAYTQFLCSSDALPERHVSPEDSGRYVLKLNAPEHGSKVGNKMYIRVGVGYRPGTGAVEKVDGEYPPPTERDILQRVQFQLNVRGPGGWRHSQVCNHSDIATINLPFIGAHFFTLYMCSKREDGTSCTDLPPDQYEEYAERSVVVDRVPMWWLENGMYAQDVSHAGFPSNAKIRHWLEAHNIAMADARLAHGLQSFLLGNVQQVERKIPRIIHQIWTGGADDLKRMANDPSASLNKRNFWKWTKSWKRHHPDHDYILWNSTSMRNLIATDYRFFLDYYDGFGQDIKRIDAARYFILHKYGGIILDIDFECLKPFDDLLSGHDIVLGREKWYAKDDANLISDAFRALATGMMASVPNHPLWWMVISQMAWRSDGAKAHDEVIGVVRHTGPNMLEETSRFYYNKIYPGAAVVVYHDEIYPSGADEQHKDAVCIVGDNCTAAYPAAHAVHHYTASWYSEYVKQLDEEYFAIKVKKRDEGRREQGQGRDGARTDGGGR